MIHTTSLTRPTQKKHVPLEIFLDGPKKVYLTGLLEYVGGSYDGTVGIQDDRGVEHTITGWGQRLGEAQSDLRQKAQDFIDGLRKKRSESMGFGEHREETSM